MFSLIITIISIALVTALALATIYYGGSAFRQGGDAAAAAQLINEGQQLSGAATIVLASPASGAPAAGFDTISTAATPTGFSLVEQKALTSAPTLWAVDTAAKSFSKATGSTAICDKVNEKAGLTARPADASGVVNYGCFGAAGAAGTMVFKY